VTETRIKQLRLIQVFGGLVCALVVLSTWIEPRGGIQFNTIRMALFTLFGLPAAIAAFLLHAEKRSRF